MADSGSAGDRGGGGGVAGDGAPLVDLMARKPPRPSLTLPPRSSLESLFHGGGGGGGGASEVSPGPLTLVSSFFAEDPESDRCSFTQLLVGEINSPAGGARGPPGAEGEQKDAVNSGSEDGGAEQGRVDGNCAGVSGLVRMGKNRPAGLEVSRPEAFMFPPGESPASLMISPGFFSSALGTFAVSHQEALAQVTAQASQSQFTMPSQAENSCVLVATSLTQHPVQEIPTLKTKYNTLEPKEGSHSDHRSQPPSIVVDKPADDGYNWRKYGQKIVKGSEYPRSYYKCSHPNCPVKKKIEHSVDGQISEIIYKGQHNHQRPKSNKRSKEGSTFATSSNESTGNVDNPSKLESDFRGHHGNLMTSNGKSTDTKNEQLSDYGTSEQLSGTSDREEAPEMLTDEREDHDADAKRMKVVASSQASSTEPRIVVQTTSEVDLLDDGYRWRKYGQKVVKGNPNPRSYYKCTFHGCNVRKHIERAATDPKAVITTYEGKHNHDVPSSRNSHHNMMVASAASSIVQSHSQASLRTTGLRNNDQQSLAVLQLKKEHEIT